MWCKIRSYRPSHATVVAYLALFVALGGSSYAAIKVTSKTVVNNSLTGADIKNESLDTRDVKNLRASDFRPGELPAGSQSPPGPKGDTGSQGERGEQGLQGPQGAQGAAPVCQGNGSGDAMVAAGSVCIDRYEVSVWSSPTGGTQYGASSDDYPCHDSGRDCKPGSAGAIYARSVPGVTPSRFITWFQAQQALANSGKRLPSSSEWQQAVAGTPDPGNSPGPQDCNTNSSGPSATGSRASCVSNHGANDMVGNLQEWVADWVPASTHCPGWGMFSDDLMCLSGASTTEIPGALIRGGRWINGADAGPFTVRGDVQPAMWFNDLGFRGAR